MMDADIQQRLDALFITVLRPHEIERPLQTAYGQRGGILGFLDKLPDHQYIQIEQGYALPASDYVLTRWQPVAAIADTYERAWDLAEQIRLLLCGSPEEPGPYERVNADQPRYSSEGFFVVRNTYARPEINGFLAG